MEIGSAYALQVCLLQIPAMVAFSAFYDPRNMGEMVDTFTYVKLPESPLPKLMLCLLRQLDIPPMGRDIHHPINLLAHVHVHRSSK